MADVRLIVYLSIFIAIAVEYPERIIAEKSPCEPIDLQLRAGGCKTNGGPRPNVPCVFPFKAYGKSFTKCIFYGSTVPWCSTEVDEQGNHIKGSWGTCGSACPKEYGCDESNGNLLMNTFASGLSISSEFSDCESFLNYYTIQNNIKDEEVCKTLVDTVVETLPGPSFVKDLFRNAYDSYGIVKESTTVADGCVCTCRTTPATETDCKNKKNRSWCRKKLVGQKCRLGWIQKMCPATCRACLGNIWSDKKCNRLKFSCNQSKTLKKRCRKTCKSFLG